MKHNLTYKIDVEDLTKIHSLPESWIGADYKEILKLLEMEGIEDLEPAALSEYAIMALQDLTSEEAADLVIEYCLQDDISPGARTELAHDLKDGHPWEEHANIKLHSKIFRAAELLQAAFPKDFNKPAASLLVFKATPSDNDAREPFSKDTPPDSLIVDILAHAQGEQGILYRLFEDEIEGEEFPEADSIIWHIKCSKLDESSWKLEVVSSNKWLENLEDIGSIDCTV
jgi:hypothetical protein